MARTKSGIPPEEIWHHDRTDCEHKFGDHPTICYIPSNDASIDTLLEDLNPKPNDVFYDLGCGDGRVVIEIARKFGIRCVGVEAALNRVNLSNLHVEQFGVKDLVTIRYENIFETDLSDATIVYMYLYYDLVNALVPILNRNPGTRVYTSFYHPTFKGRQRLTSRFVPANREPGGLREYITPIDLSRPQSP